MFKILNGYENIDSNIFFEIMKSKITRGHNYTLVKKQSRLDVRKYSFSMYGITYQLIVYMLVVLKMKLKVTKRHCWRKCMIVIES